MPFTPYHLGPGLFVGLLFLSFIDFPTFLVASVIVDVEPLLVLALNLNYPLHGFFHSFLGGTLVAVPLALVMYRVRGKFFSLMSFFKLEQEVSFKRVLAAALSGIYIHILLDSRGYTGANNNDDNRFNQRRNKVFLAFQPVHSCFVVGFRLNVQTPNQFLSLDWQ